MKIAHKIIHLITNNNKISAVHSLQIFQLIRFFSLILINIVFAKSKLNGPNLNPNTTEALRTTNLNPPSSET